MTSAPAVEPSDEPNRELVANVHPADWQNPDPAERYHLVVVGAGTGGLVTAAVASGLGARVALVERHLMGGDCLNVGCVPSKAVIRAGRWAADARRAGEVGLGPSPAAAPDFAAAMARMRRIRASISENDSARRFRDELGVDVFFGDARFVSANAVEVDGRRLCFRKAVIATGARAAVPAIPGLAEARPLTNESVFSLTAPPARLAVIGGGPIGCELAQTFARLGIGVVLLEMGEHVLAREDADAAGVVERALARDGVRLELGVRLDEVRANGAGFVLRFVGAGGVDRSERVDRILVAAGRAPNVEDLGLEDAGVAYDARSGIRVDPYLRTTNGRILAVGDCCMAWKFTHAADAAAKIAVRNALFSPLPFLRQRVDRLAMPWCTYTDPELAHVGLSEHEARERGVAVDTYTVQLAHNDRARCDGETEGFVRIHARRGSDRIVGATIVASHAGDLLSQITAAMVAGVGLGRLAGVIFPYPTQAEAIKAAANLYLRSRLTPTVQGIFRRYLAWLR
jgi:pyruvate/2-oxoglutarate dehydrogenase complex dihydrolipoamide dehydrogenase (E3) component